jgi:protocatechuate 3,4-dioxygenase beta subunit
MKYAKLTRRHFLRSALGASAVAVSLTSIVRADHPPTPDNIEGPYYRPGAPFQNQLFPDDEPGTWLLVYGLVRATDDTPLAGALLDFWQADDNGVYDNTSSDYLGRGKQLADDNGVWWIWTVWPGYYPGRTKHIHVKVSQDGYRPLTTQLYFHDDPQNASDPYYLKALELHWFEWSGQEGAYAARFPFVLPPS